MRDFKSMKRQRGRNRSGGPGGGGGGGGKPQQNANRAFESNGPDNLKIRGHAQHVYEKYQQLARDAMSAGDRVLGENFLQHAEHYFRLIRTLQPNRPYTDIVSREGFASGYDIDFEDEGVDAGEEQEQSADAGEPQSGEDRGDYRDQQVRQDRWDNRGGDGRQDQSRGDQSRQDYGRSDQNRSDQPRQDRGGYGAARNNNAGGNNGARDRTFNRNDRWENRNGDGQSDRNQADRNQNDGARFDNRDGQTGELRGDDRRPERQDRIESNREQPRGDRDGYSRRERGAYGERNGQGRDPLPVVEPQAAPLTAETPTPTSESAPAGKPVRTPRVLRSQDGDESHAPAFLGAAPSVVEDSGTDTPAKRPRGRPKKIKDEAAVD